MGHRGMLIVPVAVLAVGFLAALPACDWLKGSDPGARQSPYISNLRISESSVRCENEFIVSFRYDDPQGDIAMARVSFQLAGSVEVREETPLWPEGLSRKSGTVDFPFTFDCDSSGGKYSITVQAEDDREHLSYPLYGEISLIAAL